MGEVGHRVEGCLLVIGEIGEVPPAPDHQGFKTRAAEGCFGIAQPLGKMITEKGSQVHRDLERRQEIEDYADSDDFGIINDNRTHPRNQDAGPLGSCRFLLGQ